MIVWFLLGGRLEETGGRGPSAEERGVNRKKKRRRERERELGGGLRLQIREGKGRYRLHQRWSFSQPNSWISIAKVVQFPGVSTVAFSSLGAFKPAALETLFASVAVWFSFV